MTINIDLDISTDWTSWMHTFFIPELIDTALVVDNRFYRLLTEAEGNGETYSIQLFFNSMEEFEQYENQKFNPHLELMYAKYPGKFVEFRSILATVKPL